jgi:hypothetical protein
VAFVRDELSMDLVVFNKRFCRFDKLEVTVHPRFTPRFSDDFLEILLQDFLVDFVDNLLAAWT